jgi:Flp pilus assembly protein TadG
MAYIKPQSANYHDRPARAYQGRNAPLFPTPCSLFPCRNAPLFPVPCSLFPVPCSLPKARGQVVPLAALILPVLLAFVLLAVEVAERWLEVAMIEDALQQATRSAVQQLDYSAFARNEAGLRASEACDAVTAAQAAQDGRCAAIVAVADQFLRTNLIGVRGLRGTSEADAIDAAAQAVRWTVLPNGGSCTFSNGTSVLPETTPLICAELRPTLKGIVGWGDYRPLITAADRLDVVQ